MSFLFCHTNYLLLYNDFIGGYTIPFSSFVTARQPTNPVLQIAGDTLKKELLLQWQ